MRRATLIRFGVLLATLCCGAPALSQTIDIGLAAPLTGPVALLGNQVKQGAEVAIDEINAKGGVLGRKLALKTADDGCEPARAMQVASRLTQAEKVVAVIGHVCGPASVASAPVYAQMRVPMVILAPADRRLTEAAAKNGWRNVFLMAGSIQTQGFAAGTYLVRRYKGNGIALISDQSAYGSGLADGFKQALKDRSSSPKFETSLTGNVVDVGPTVEQLRAANPSAVYLAMTPANAGALVKRAKESGLDTTFVSGNAVGRREFLNIAGRASEGVVGTALPDARSSAMAAEAVARLRQRGSTAEGYTLYAYAAIQVMAQAIEKAGSERFDSIEPFLRRLTFSTAVGNVKFDETGDREVSEVAFTQWRDGSNTPFNTTDFWNVSRDAMSVTRPSSTPGNRGKRPILIDASDGSLIEAKALQGVYWNTYFTRENEPDAKLSTQSQSSYTLVLDLSAYNYRQVRETNAAGTAVDLRVKSALEKAPEEPVELKIRPVVVTPVVTIEDVPVKSMRVDRKKLVRPQEGDAATEEDRLVGRFKGGAISLPDFSGTVAAGRVTFQVKVVDNVEPGCVVIAFTIWDFRDNPIDALLQTVPVGDGKTQPDCSRMNPEALKGGFATLLNPVFSIGSANAEDPIQAALHLFQIMAQGQKKTIAIFVDKTQYQPPQPGQPTSERGVYGWQTSQWLSDYIGDANGLPARISAAWDAADNGVPSPYAGVADELAGQVFGTSAAEQPKADAARGALRKLAGSQDRPVVVIRMVNENNRKFYVPFNLISAAGNTDGLPGPVTVVQPLQIERYEAPTCIGNWAFALSKDTRDLDANIKKELDALEKERPATGEIWVRNAAELKTYFQASPPSTAPASPVPAEGLLLLAHHDQFGIFFDDVNGRVVARGLRHTYSPGSIAVLAACGTAKPDSGMDTLNGLNDDGIDAMIVSPFNVRIDYGSRMALEFAKVVRDNRLNGRSPTLAEMFSQATAATFRFFKDPKNHNSNARLEDMGLEFILAGNPYLRMCSP
jgi:branched-chain amino acid transport system substrate-binding protein